MFREIKLSLEVVILLIGGISLLLAGSLLFPISAGTFDFHENGLFGLLLIIFALQMIALGKTPFGDAARSLFLTAAGALLAAIGLFTCFIPIEFQLPRVLLFLCFGLGGSFLLLRLCVSKGQLRPWLKLGGTFHHLIFAAVSVHLLSILFGLLLLKRALLTNATAGVLILLGLATLYLASALQIIYRRYPEAEKQHLSGRALSTEHALLLLMSVFMLLLGALLVPVSLGLLPFSPSGQLGLLMVLFALQMLASGSTPIGQFPRSLPVMTAGLACASLGIISCVIPGILVKTLTILVGLLNISGGLIALSKLRAPSLHPNRGEEPAALALTKLFRAQLTMNLLTIIFGFSMLIPGLIPGIVIGLILAANGCVLVYLLNILIKIDRLLASAAYLPSEI